MEWASIGGGVLAAMVGPAVTHWFQGRQERAKEDRQEQREEAERHRKTQCKTLVQVQGAMEQLNLSHVRWGAGKLATAEIMIRHPEGFAHSDGWPRQLPPSEFEDLADQGEAALRVLIPAIADPAIGQHVEEFQRQAREALFGRDSETTARAVKISRDEQNAANARIGQVLQDL